MLVRSDSQAKRRPWRSPGLATIFGAALLRSIRPKSPADPLTGRELEIRTRIALARSGSILPGKRTSLEPAGMSQKCHEEKCDLTALCGAIEGFHLFQVFCVSAL